MTQIIVGVIGLVSLVLTGVLIPFVRSRMSTAQLEQLDYWVQVLVAAAETMYAAGGTGEAKKAWVYEQLQQRGVKFDVVAVDAAIEAAVRELTANGVINE